MDDVYKSLGGSVERAAIQRALVTMVRAGDLSYTHERKMVTREK